MSIDVKELLKLVEGDSSESLDTVYTLEDFIEDIKLTKGTDRIPNYILYYTYKEVYNGTMSKIELNRQLSKLGFIKVRTGKVRAWLFDGSSFDLTREGKLRARFHEKKEKQKR